MHGRRKRMRTWWIRCQLTGHGGSWMGETVPYRNQPKGKHRVYKAATIFDPRVWCTCLLWTGPGC